MLSVRSLLFHLSEMTFDTIHTLPENGTAWDWNNACDVYNLVEINKLTLTPCSTLFPNNWDPVT